MNRNETWNETTKRHDFPQTPSRIQFSLWPGGDSSNGVGTIEWAGGEIDWNAEDIKKYGYFYAHIKEIDVEVYDLPGNVSLSSNSSNSDDYHAFLYDSTDGDESNIYLTNKKTWLGNDDATHQRKTQQRQTKPLQLRIQPPLITIQVLESVGLCKTQKRLPLGIPQAVVELQG